MSGGSGIRYRPDVDGLRALAVIPVVLFHGHIGAFAGGFVGVDVFFVISGFLICSLIAKELDRSEFSILRFYERRCRRILPALFAVFVATSALAWMVLMPPDMESFGSSLLASLLFASNIYFWKTSGYFDGAAEFKPLLHTWSLSVEEQFYLIVPYVLIATAAFFRRKYVLVLLPMGLVSFALSVWGVQHAPSATFYMLPTRFWELLLGGLIGLGVASGPARRGVREVLSLVGLSSILAAVLLYSDATAFPGAAALLPCGGAALIIYAGVGGASTVARALSLRPVVFVGKISYSLYLWHWPLLALHRYHVGRAPTLAEAMVLMTLSVALAVASYHLIEQPFRRSQRPIPPRAIFRGAAAGAFLTASFAGTAMATGGLPARVPGFRFVAVPGEEEYDVGHGACFLIDRDASHWGGARCFVSRGRGPTVLLWGDSFAAHYVPGLERHAGELEVDILQYTMSACPPVLGFETMSNPPCKAFNDGVFEVAEAYGAREVIVSGRWDYALKRHATPEQIGETFRRLREAGLEVTVIGQSPLFGNQVQTLFAQAGGTPERAEGAGHLALAPDLNRRLAAVVPPGVAFKDPLETWCRSSLCVYRVGGEFMFSDEGHLSSQGSSLAVKAYFPHLPSDARAGAR